MIARKQFFFSLTMLATLCATFLAVVAAARFTPLIADHAERELALQREVNGLLYYDAGYIDEGDYVLLGQLPHDDFSRGGVYFIGSSEMNTALMTTRLTPGERRLIHNYAIGDTRYTEARHYIRMLVEDFDLLQASGDKTTIVFVLSFQMARVRQGALYVENLFERHGLYTYDWEAGIARAPKSALVRRLITERDRANRFLRILFLSPSRVVIEPDTMEGRLAHMHRVMPGDWRAMMRDEIGQLLATIDYLQARGVRVRALFPASGSWQDDLGYEPAFRAMVAPPLAERGVPIDDYGDLLSDAEFMDAIHARYSGQLKVHAAYRELALRELAAMGIAVER